VYAFLIICYFRVLKEAKIRRTPIDVMSRAIVRKTHVWDTESDKRLVEAVRKYGTESWSLGIPTYVFFTHYH
jgi:hypothetical protein